MAVISKGIKLYCGDNELINLQEIPDLSVNFAEAIEITTLADAAHIYTDGLFDYGDSLEFKFLYDAEQFTMLNALKGEQEWRVELPEGETCSFSGSCSVKIDGVGVAAAITFTLAIRPSSEMVFAGKA